MTHSLPPSLTLLMLAALGCDPPTGFFIEPTASDGELQTYPRPRGVFDDGRLVPQSNR